MKAEAVVFWLRVKRVARFDPRRAVQMLLHVGAELSKAVRFVALCRSQVMA